MALLEADLPKLVRVAEEINQGIRALTQRLPPGSSITLDVPLAWAGPAMHPLLILTSSVPTASQDLSGKMVMLKLLPESFRVQALPIVLSVSLVLSAINNEFSVDDSGSDTTTCLREAVMSNLKVVMGLLLKIPTLDPNVQCKPYGSTALISALFHGYADAAALLLADPRVDVNMTNYKGGSALIISAQHARPDCIRLLLRHPLIDVNKIDADGLNALHWYTSPPPSHLPTPVTLNLPLTPLFPPSPHPIALVNRTIRAISKLMHERDSWLKKNLPVLCLSHLDCLQQLLAVPCLDLGVRLQCEEQSPSNNLTRYLSALAVSVREHLPACVDLLLARDDIIVDEDALTAACIEPDNEAGYLGKLLRHRNFSAFSKLVALWHPGCSEDRRCVVPREWACRWRCGFRGQGGQSTQP